MIQDHVAIDSLFPALREQVAMAKFTADQIRENNNPGLVPGVIRDLARPTHWGLPAGPFSEKTFLVRRVMEQYVSIVALLLADFNVERADELIGMTSSLYFLQLPEFVQAVRDIAEQRHRH
jgi:hypothetical protein